MKKLLLILLITVIFSVKATAGFRYEEISNFQWDEQLGLKTKLHHSGNYAILSFEILDNDRVAFLSNVEKNIKIYSKDGQFLNAFDLDFIPEDFVYNNNKFYVLSNYLIYEYNDSGALIKKYSINKEFKFINRLSAFKNDLYVLTSDEKSYPVIKNSLYLDTISQINNEINGWLLGENFKCKTIKLSNNTFSLQISNQKNLNFEKTYDLDKKLATVTILGKYKSKLFLNIEYFKNEVPIKIEREILVYSLTEKEIVNKMKLPNMYFIYMKHDIKINDNGVFYFIATPKKGILYQLIYDEKLNKDIVPDFKEEYHYNEHLLRSKDGSIKNSFSKEELPISRAEIIQNSAEYESLEWTATTSNISNGIVQTPDGAYIDTPDWVTIGQKQKVPYKWGGWTEIDTFVAQMSNGVYAGDNYCESVSWGPTYCVGVDCSGLVSRAWGLSQKYGTSTLPDISTAYSTFNELKHGDIINKAGHHVRLVISDNPTGTINTVESSAVDWRVSYRDYNIIDLEDYTPRYYNYIQNLEMASPIVISPNPMIYEEQVTATVSITNFDDVGWAGNIYMAIHDNDGNFLYNIDSEEGGGVTIANNVTEYFEFQDILEFDNYNGPGTYEIHLKYQNNGTVDFYLVPPVDNYTNPINVEIEETTIINVPADYQTIQAGIDAASDGNTVLVQPGTYYENINYNGNGKNITVGSLFLTTQDTSYISQTVIDGDSSGSVVTFENEEDSNSVLNGFTLKNGSGTYADPDSNGYYDYIGGGIYCVNSSPSLENVTIKGNSAHKGGGIYCYNSSPSLKNVTITGNCASDGGGIYCYESSPSLENVNIKGNSATGYFASGGGIYCSDSSPSLENVNITDNSAEGSGGGIYCDHSSPSLENVTITGNSAGWGGGGICCSYCSRPSLENVTITGNSAYFRGGGIYCSDSFPNLENVTITDNSAESSGGGIYFYVSVPSLENVTITGNSATGGGGIGCTYSTLSLENVILALNSAVYGGGISCNNSHLCLGVVNVTITGNSAVYGGGIYWSGHSIPSLVNVTITGNIAVYGGGIFCNSSLYPSYPSLSNCILWNDYPQEIYFSEDSDPDTITISYSDVQGGESGIITNNNGTVNWLEGNIDADPLFLDPANGDYHLNENSPCIDAGDPDSPLDPDGTIADMGAYYYDHGEIILIWPGDTDYNGFVNEEDILPIGVYWRDTGSPRSSISFEWIENVHPGGWDEPYAALADCNGDGEVNITDVLAICLNWNKTHSTVLESPFVPKDLEQYRDNFVEIYNSLGNSEIEIKIRNHIAEKFDLPIIEIVKVNKLYQNYPNPFSTRGGSRYISGNPETTISFSIKQNSKIELEIFNVKGQKVKTLISDFRQSGNHSIFWNGDDAYGNKVGSGLYFYKLNINGRTEDVKKCLLVK